jgi:hypothetical protein
MCSSIYLQYALAGIPWEASKRTGKRLSFEEVSWAKLYYPRGVRYHNSARSARNSLKDKYIVRFTIYDIRYSKLMRVCTEFRRRRARRQRLILQIGRNDTCLPWVG